MYKVTYIGIGTELLIVYVINLFLNNFVYKWQTIHGLIKIYP